jgi:hypothetical protein
MSKALLDSKISISEKVAELPIGGQLLYTWMLPHADNLGFIQGSPKTIKAKVVPMLEVTEAQVDEWVTQMIRNGLVRDVTWRNKSYYLITDHYKNQTRRKDINPQTIIEFDYKGSPRENWDQAEEILKTMLENNAPSQSVTSRNVTSQSEEEVKLSKAKLLNNSRAVVKKKTQNEEDQPPRSETS